MRRRLHPVFALAAVLFVAFAVSVAGAAKTRPAQIVDGAKVYTTQCIACHKATGLGSADTIPPLAGSEWVTGDVGRMVRVLLNGLIGEVEVQGELFNGSMPPWGPTLSNAEIAAVATYVRSSWGNKAAPIATVTVARIRDSTATRKTPWTAAELKRIRP